jgi:pilus assembly protein FimV
MIYSPSQLDAVDDVDPVAEADVYLAYGRDIQAEEILKDALRTNPERLAIHQKLLEIYAKRRDAKMFEAVAIMAFNLTDGRGTDWERICDKGLTLDPNNALYLPGGQPFGEMNSATRPADIDVHEPTLTDSNTGNNLDLDLDFSLDEPDAAPSIKPAEANDVFFASTEAISAVPKAPVAQPDLVWAPDPPLPEIEDQGDAFDKTLVLSAMPVPVPAPEPTLAEPAVAEDSGMMAFDLGSLSLDFASTKPGDLGPPVAKEPKFDLQHNFDEPVTQPGEFIDTTDDPLGTKLALAEEFKAIGDEDGARALIEEVVAEATGDMKAKAQRALSRL